MKKEGEYIKNFCINTIVMRENALLNNQNFIRRKKMKKVLIALFACLMVVCCFGLAACTGNGEANIKYNENYRVAMITDYGDITDQSFNQTTYEACKEFCEAFSIQFKYYKPAGDSTEARVASVNTAIAEGYNVIVMPGYAFGATIEATAGANPKVTFLALDVGAGDFSKGYVLPANVTSFVYQEELAGFMAGYAAVKEGYEKLGFLGGIGVPAVKRFGFGFVQGADLAAKEMSKTDRVSIQYIYGGQFYGDSDITAVMDTWYGEKGVQAVFACGGGIFTSACEAAVKVNGGKVIGVDVDQSAIINAYKDGLCITSAMKGLAATVKTVLANTVVGNWSIYSSKISTMGLISATDPSVNYVQLPMDTWSMTTFTKDDYKALVAKLYNGEITVSNDISVEKPETTITVNVLGNIKG